MEEKQGQEPNITTTTQSESVTLDLTKLPLQHSSPFGGQGCSTHKWKSLLLLDTHKASQEASFLMTGFRVQNKIFFFFLIKHNGISKRYFSWELSQLQWKPSIVLGSGWEEQPPPGEQNPDPIPNTQLPPGEPCYWCTHRLRKSWKYSVQGGLPAWDLPHMHPPCRAKQCWLIWWREKLHNTPFFFFFLQHNSGNLKVKTLSQKFNMKLSIIPVVLTPTSCSTLPHGTHNHCCDGGTYLGYSNIWPPCFLHSHNSMQQEGQSNISTSLPQNRKEALPNIQLPASFSSWKQNKFVTFNIRPAIFFPGQHQKARGT